MEAETKHNIPTNEEIHKMLTLLNSIKPELAVSFGNFMVVLFEKLSEKSRIIDEFVKLSEEFKETIQLTKQKTKEEISEKYEQRILKLQTENYDLNEKLQELQSSNQELQKNSNEFKEHLIKLLGGRKELSEKPLDFIKELYEATKNIKSNSQINPKPTFSEPINEINPLSQDYIRSEKCVCGNSKNYGSKGCKKCNATCEKYRKRNNCGREDAWIILWKEQGVPMDKFTSELEEFT